MELRSNGAVLLHEDDFRVVMSHLNARRPVLLLGGAGFGKTTLLQRVEQALRRERQEGFAPYFVDDPQHARRLILDGVATHRVVLIDDLDKVCAPRPEDGVQTLETLDAALLAILAAQKSIESSRFLATASIDANGPTVGRLFSGTGTTVMRHKRVDAYSEFTQQLQSHPLRPWKAGWRKQREEQFLKALRDVLKPVSLLQIWRDAVLDRTGGHPSLWGSMLDHLRDLCQRDTPGAEFGFEAMLLGRLDQKTAYTTLAADIGRYTEDYLTRHSVRRLRSALRRLKDSDDSFESESFLALVDIAKRTPSDSKPPTEMHVRRILLDDGFLYQDHVTGRLLIPGTILRALVLEVARIGSAHAELDIALEPDPGVADSGTLRVRLGLTERSVSLSGASWRVMKALADRPGETVSRSRLREVAVLADDSKAVVNAVQRLQQRLKAHRLGDLIVNTYGKGYRLARDEAAP